MGCVISISMVKNEADVIESFVRHTISFVDQMLIADHSSTDKTPEILRQLQAEGLPLRVRRVYAAGYVQVETMNALLREAAMEEWADIVLPLDADEFLIADEGAMSCRAIVQGLDSNRIYRLPWRLYEPVYPHEEEARFLLARPLRRGTAFASGQKVMIGGALYRSAPFYLSEGSHYGWRPGPSGEEKVAWVDAPQLHLAHFPWRSNEQYLSKSQTIWLNSIAKYSYETPTTLLSPRYWKIAAGEGEGCTFEGPWEFVDLSHVAEPVLKYSEDVRPDPARRLLDVGTQIAAARAEERVLMRRRRATIVLPYLGDEKALRQSLQAAYEQLYPYKEVFILPLVSPDEAVQAAAAEAADFPTPMGDDAFAPAETMPVVLLNSAAGDVFEQLAAQAKGDYVQWLFPGDQPQPDKITKMLACLELQDFPLSFALTNDRRQYADWLPWIRLPDDDRFQMTSPEALWRFLLTQGKYPACGIGGALFRREMMETRRWLADGFLGDRPLFLTMWRLLLTPQPGETLRQDVAILPHAYGQFPRDIIDLSDWIWHQIEWFCLLEQDRNFLGDEAYRQAHTWLQENAAVTADRQADIQPELWAEYQAVLTQL